MHDVGNYTSPTSAKPRRVCDVTAESDPDDPTQTLALLPDRWHE